MKRGKITFGRLDLITEERDGKNVLSWEGESNLSNPGIVLTPFLEELLAEIEEPLEIYFNNLEFMNSATIQPVIMFLKKLNQKEISVILHYAKQKKWQTISFGAMKDLSKVLPYITIIGD